jgi:hypothetical protein
VDDVAAVQEICDFPIEGKIGTLARKWRVQVTKHAQRAASGACAPAGSRRSPARADGGEAPLGAELATRMTMPSPSGRPGISAGHWPEPGVLHAGGYLVRKGAPCEPLDKPQCQVQAAGDAACRDQGALVDDPILYHHGAQGRQFGTGTAVRGRAPWPDDAGMGQQQGTRAHPGHESTAAGRLREQGRPGALGYLAADAALGVRRPASARNHYDVGTGPEHGIRAQPQAVGTGYHAARPASGETDLEVCAGPGGPAQYLQGADRIHLVKAVVNSDVNLHHPSMAGL